MIKNIKKLGFTLLGLVIQPIITFADAPPIVPEDVKTKIIIPSVPQGAGATMSTDDFLTQKFLPTLTKMLIFPVAGTATLMIIIAGIMMLTAYGKEEQVGTAKKMITYAIVGLVVCMLSYTIVIIISSLRSNLTNLPQGGNMALK